MVTQVAGGKVRVHLATPGETWESIAFEYYGDRSLGNSLAVYNQFKSGHPSGPVLPGRRILIQ